MISTVISFQNCNSAVEELKDPNTGEVVGRAFLIIDDDNDTVYQYSMTTEVAKTQGQRLMGIGHVSVADGVDLKQELSRHNRHPKGKVA